MEKFLLLEKNDIFFRSHARAWKRVKILETSLLVLLVPTLARGNELIAVLKCNCQQKKGK
jgi:hypothetical protein